MRARSPERLLAAASLALVLIVVVASAAIRLSGQDLGSYLPLVRATHRASASLATLLILAACWLAWRSGRRLLALLILALTLGLSVLGAATGIAPPPWAQAGNLIGGLLLAALLAALLGSGKGSFRPYLLFGLLQILLGAWIAVFAEDLFTPVLLTHALLGLGLAAAAAWVFLRLRKPLQRVAAVLLAFAVPVSGAASALLGLPFAAMLAHSTSVALLVCAAAYSHAVLLDPHQGAAGADLRR